MLSNNRNNILVVIILSAVVLLLCILCVTLVYDDKNESINNVTPSYQTELSTEKATNPSKPIKAPTESTTKATAPIVIVTEPATMKTETMIAPPPIQTETQTEPKTEAISTEPSTENDEDKLVQLIQKSGYTMTDIESQGIEQLIVVISDKTDATVYMFSLTDDIWKDEEITSKAYVGSAGIGNKQTDDDDITPYGLYSLGEAFYTDTQPSTWLNSFVITEDTYWITDAESEMYNKKVEGEQGKDWNKAIHMIDSESYKYGCVINYNTNPITTGKGSAIFMCCGTNTTNGSIALEENNLLAFLNILNSEKNPHILIF